MPGETVTPLPQRWMARWDQMMNTMALGVVFIPLGERLLQRYSESGRHYHDARHVLSCLNALDAYMGNIHDPDALELAIWYHDAIYDPRAASGANEDDSAALFETEFGVMARELIETAEVKRLILATKHSAEPDDGDAALMIDIDLGILGADAVRYDTYAEDIRKEYAHVPDAEFAKGRAAVLREFLGRRSIYHTRHFKKLLEAPARENMMRELEAISA